MKIQIYHNPETDLFDLSVSGSTEYDDMNDLTEQEADDEADHLNYLNGAPIVRT